jgi:NAD(P)-dependent dehydrogenase (short-subunit alcohol dehydrogenase family)
MAMDLANLESVVLFVENFKKLGLPLHLLINNADVMVPPYQESAQGHDLTFAVNHLGHFHLTQLVETNLLETGTKAEPARVVFLASVAAQSWSGPNDKGMADFLPPTLSYHPYHTYDLSKALNVLTAKEQQRHWSPDATAISVAVHPGIIATDLLGHNGKDDYPIEGASFGWPFSYCQKSVAQHREPPL